jgi:hypothetical protein
VSFSATVYRVLIASPGDLHEERGTIEEVIHLWNASHAAAEGTVLLPVRWETHSVPEYGDRPQAILNRRMIADCDLLVGAFWTRLGTPTGAALSGTVEEIEQFRSAGKPVMLYFSSRQVDPNKIDLEQFGRVREFRTHFEQMALTDWFASPAELHIKLTRHLQEQVRRLIGSGAATPMVREGGGPDRPSPAPPGAGPETPSGEEAPQSLYSDYWNAFREALTRSGSRLRPPTVRDRNYVRFPMGSGDRRMYCFISARERYLGVELVLDRPENNLLFDALRTRHSEFEAEIGGNLEWLERDGSCRVVQHLYGCDPQDRSQWPQQHEWLRVKLEKFTSVFSLAIAEFRSR